MKKAKEKAKCPCGAKVRKYRSIDDKKSGKCNNCIRNKKRVIGKKDSSRHIYVNCPMCNETMRYSKKLLYEFECKKCV